METEEKLLSKEEIIQGDVIFKVTDKVVELFREHGWMNKSNKSLKGRTPFGLAIVDKETYGISQKDLYEEKYHYKNNSYKDEDKVIDGYKKLQLLELLDENKIKYSIETQAEREMEFEHKGFVIKLSREFADNSFTAIQDKNKTTSKYSEIGVSGRWGEDVLKAASNVKDYINKKIENYETTKTYSGIQDIRHETYTLEGGNISADVSLKMKFEVDRYNEDPAKKDIKVLNDIETFTILKADGNIIEVSRSSDYKHHGETDEDCIKRVKVQVAEDFKDSTERTLQYYKFHGEYKRW